MTLIVYELISCQTKWFWQAGVVFSWSNFFLYFGHFNWFWL